MGADGDFDRDSIGFPKRRAGHAHRSIGQERVASSLDENWPIGWRLGALLDPLYFATKGEPAWPPLSIWYDPSDVRLAEARASFHRFCGFSANEATSERPAFVRHRKVLVTHGLDAVLFDAGPPSPTKGGQRSWHIFEADFSLVNLYRARH